MAVIAIVQWYQNGHFMMMMMMIMMMMIALPTLLPYERWKEAQPADISDRSKNFVCRIYLSLYSYLYLSLFFRVYLYLYSYLYLSLFLATLVALHFTPVSE